MFSRSIRPGEWTGGMSMFAIVASRRARQPDQSGLLIGMNRRTQMQKARRAGTNAKGRAERAPMQKERRAGTNAKGPQSGPLFFHLEF
jgi:hypothetical protein